jgi:hypothetical protein
MLAVTFLLPGLVASAGIAVASLYSEEVLAASPFLRIAQQGNGQLAAGFAEPPSGRPRIASG